MSLYRRKNSQYWWIKVMRNGKRIYMSSGTADRTEAEILERALKLRLGGGTREKFIAMVDALMGEERMGEVGDEVILDKLAEVYPELAEKEGVRVTEETMRKRKSACSRLATWSRGTAVVFAGDVDVPTAWRFIDSVGEKATARTQRKVAGELSAVWSTLMRRGLVKDNPWGKAKPQRRQDEEKTGRAFTEEEVQAILTACSEEWERAAVILGVQTGLRVKDIFELQWGDVDLEARVLRLKPSKTRRHHIEVCLPLHGALCAYLARLRACGGEGERGHSPAEPNTSRKVLQATCKAGNFGEHRFKHILKRAGIVEQPGEKLSFHCTRHTFATMLARAGATEQERMKLGGWTDARTADIYNHDDKRAREIIDGLKLGIDLSCHMAQ